ncbi:phage shock protein C (PspC) family protein [Tepidibacillus fermentans]|uniref:Phage shock protein C (PspC) family protein n=2 Tax=Tepidibacillus fermentans TaxID=1281767 RepID=A0A4R3KIN6_9BACI|nr:phage shock protein C (PspC) family protein [Tepidibacillus fermentans]
MVGGVLGGVAEYFNIDVTVVRLVYALLVIPTGLFPLILAYIIALFIIPEEHKGDII